MTFAGFVICVNTVVLVLLVVALAVNAAWRER